MGRAIFDARRDVNSIIHAHPHAVMAVASTEPGLLPLSQAAFFLHGQIGRYKYDFSYESEFEDAIAHQFASGKRAVMLDHHGLYAVGRSAQEAWFVTFHSPSLRGTAPRDELGSNSVAAFGGAPAAPVCGDDFITRLCVRRVARVGGMRAQGES